MQIEMWPLARVQPYPGNPRTINDAAIDAVAKSIQTFGFRVPILIDADGVIIAGHTRLRAARKLGLKEVPVIRAKDLTPDQVRALRIADNATAERSSWDLDLLPIELVSLQAVDFDLRALGFAVDRIEHFLAIGGHDGQADPDAIPEPRPRPRAKSGQLWLLGEHRLLVGDATSADDTRRLMAGAQAAMVYTDPPYGVAYVGAGKRWAPIAGDDLTGDALIALLSSAFRHALSAMAPNAAAYIWHASSTRGEYAYAMQTAGLRERQYIVWAKQSFVLGRSDYQNAIEPCFYASRDGETPVFYGDRAQSTAWLIAATRGPHTSTAIGQGVTVTDGHGHEMYCTPRPPKGRKTRVLRAREGGSVTLTRGEEQSDVWEISRDSGGSAVHPTQKPVALAGRAICNSSRPGEAVLDLFLGSGSTLIACEQQGRRCYGLEIDPGYASQVIDRWEQFTGRKAEREP